MLSSERSWRPDIWLGHQCYSAWYALMLLFWPHRYGSLDQRGSPSLGHGASPLAALCRRWPYIWGTLSLIWAVLLCAGNSWEHKYSCRNSEVALRVKMREQWGTGLWVIWNISPCKTYRDEKGISLLSLRMEYRAEKEENISVFTTALLWWFSL